MHENVDKNQNIFFLLYRVAHFYNNLLIMIEAYIQIFDLNAHIVSLILNTHTAQAHKVSKHYRIFLRNF